MVLPPVFRLVGQGRLLFLGIPCTSIFEKAEDLLSNRKILFALVHCGVDTTAVAFVYCLWWTA